MSVSCLPVQVLGERLLASAALARVQLVIPAQVVGARRGVAAPFAIVRAHFNAAVAVPAVGQGGFSIKIGFSAF